MYNNICIDKINNEIIRIMKNAVEESKELVEKEKVKLDAFSITHKNIESINNITNSIKLFEDNIKLFEENIYIIENISSKKEISLYDDLKNIKLEYINIKGNKFYVSTYKDCIVHLCDYLTQDKENKDRFLNCVKKMDKIFSHDKDKLSSPKLIKNIDVYIETRRNANALANIMKKIILECGLSIDDVRLGIK